MIAAKSCTNIYTVSVLQIFLLAYREVRPHVIKVSIVYFTHVLGSAKQYTWYRL